MRARPPSRRRLALALAVAAAVVAVDQVTKSLAEAHIARPVHLWGPFGLSLGYNSGSAFSFFTGDARVLAAVAAVLVVVVAALAWRSSTRGVAGALGLVLGGAVGNLSDRVFRGHHGAVIDFITLTHWPTFNVADSCITVGIVLVALLSWRTASRPTRPPPASPPSASPPAVPPPAASPQGGLPPPPSRAGADPGPPAGPA